MKFLSTGDENNGLLKREKLLEREEKMFSYNGRSIRVTLILLFKILKRNCFQARILYLDKFSINLFHGLIKIIFKRSCKNKVFLRHSFSFILSKDALHKKKKKKKKKFWGPG